jgi:exodeoxyribonuclease-3
LAALIADCGYLHEPRTEKLSDHSALSICLTLSPPRALPVSDPVTATELPTLF